MLLMWTKRRTPAGSAASAARRVPFTVTANAASGGHPVPTAQCTTDIAVLHGAGHVGLRARHRPGRCRPGSAPAAPHWRAGARAPGRPTRRPGAGTPPCGSRETRRRRSPARGAWRPMPRRARVAPRGWRPALDPPTARPSAPARRSRPRLFARPARPSGPTTADRDAPSMAAIQSSNSARNALYPTMSPSSPHRALIEIGSH